MAVMLMWKGFCENLSTKYVPFDDLLGFFQKAPLFCVVTLLNNCEIQHKCQTFCKKKITHTINLAQVKYNASTLVNLNSTHSLQL